MEHQTSQETARSNDELSQGKKSWSVRVALLLSSVMMTVLALVGMGVTKPSSTGLVSLPQSVAPQVASAKLLGATPDSQQISLSVSLHSRNQAELQDYAQQVSQPKSKLFHQYLTPAQFASVFGADPAALNAVERYMQSSGLHLDNAQSGGLFLTFSGTVSQVDAAFHTHINNYKAADGRMVYANADALQVPSALAPSIMDVAGTEDIRVEHPAGVTSAHQPKVTSHVTVTCPTVTTANFTGAGPYTFAGLLPAQIAKAYNMTGTNLGNGVWVAMIEQDGFSSADLAQYASCIGLTSAQQTAIAATPGTSYSSSSLIQIRTPGLSQAYTPGANAQSVEAELEVILGLTPYLTHLTVVEAKPSAWGTLQALSDIANNNGPQVVGDQWGMCESDLGWNNAQAEEQLFMQMALQGQSAFAATGNNGLYACNGDGLNFHNSGFGAMDPASDPFVTAVGGTELGVGGNTATTTTWSAEQPWINANLTSSGTYAAGGGGISEFWAAQSWQTGAKSAFATNPAGSTAQVGAQSTYNNGTTPARVIPDVSAAADPNNSSVAIYCSVGSSCTSGATTFTNVGGTDIANAIWVATAAQAVQAAAPGTGTGGRLGLIAPALYTTYQNDLTNGGTAANQITQPGGAGTKYCDYGNVLGAALATATNFSVACAGTAATDYILNDASITITANSTITSVFPQSAGYQQLPAAGTYSSALGFSAVEAAGHAVSGYNALTGLGSPNVGNVTGGAQLAAYLTAQSRVAIPRMYMVAESTSANNYTYWIGSFGLNPTATNMETTTQWYQLSSAISFTGAPSMVDDSLAAGNNGVAKNLYIFGPTNATTTTIGIIKWNIATATATVVTQSVAGAPSALSGNTNCANVTAFVNTATGTGAGVFCVTPAGNLYSNTITLASGAYGSASWTGPVLTNVSGQPAVANDGSNHYEIVLQNVGSNNLQYVPSPSTESFAVATGATPFSSLSTLQTTCNSTPALAYIPQLTSYAASCTAADTKNMWANVFNPAKTSNNWGWWQRLGQPSPSVTLQPGAAVAVDSVANDPGYGAVFYIAEGSDGGMYLDIANPEVTTTVGYFSGWTNVSLPGIFNGNAAADFAAA